MILIYFLSNNNYLKDILPENVFFATMHSPGAVSPFRGLGPQAEDATTLKLGNNLLFLFNS